MILLQEAALRYNTKTPRYLHIASQKKNRWGHQRSYRLQVFSFTGDHLPESQAEEAAMSWARWVYIVKKKKPLSFQKVNDHKYLFCLDD